jgi:Common central domain of tyrosinase
MIVRRNIYSLSENEVKEFVRGVKALKQSGVYAKLWRKSMMGGSGNPVTTGPFVPSEWSTVPAEEPGRFKFETSLVRELAGSGQPVTTVNTVLRLFRSSTYDGFRVEIEAGPHAIMHEWVGGQMKWILASPNDPAFWLHHANLDRIWAQWQELYPNAPTVAESNFGPSNELPPTEPGAVWRLSAASSTACTKGSTATARCGARPSMGRRGPRTWSSPKLGPRGVRGWRSSTASSTAPTSPRETTGRRGA